MVALAWSKLPADDAETAALFSLPDRWPIPVFPLGGDDAIRQGIGRGPAVGAALKAVEAWWVENDFEPDESALRARLQQMTAGAQ
jgi:poly(A) polymerase